MKKIVVILMTAVWLFGASASQIISDAYYVLRDFTNLKESKIPAKLLREAKAIVVVPGLLRGAFIVGGRYGEGVLLVRCGSGWSDPVFVKVAGGSLGWQIGVESIDLVLVFRSRESVRKLLGGKFTLGVDGSVAVGPVGRTGSAATDIELHSEIYSYSRSRGAFAGVSLSGVALSIDEARTHAYYHASPRGVLVCQVRKGSSVVHRLVELLGRF